jgi:hypothetical protein
VSLFQANLKWTIKLIDRKSKTFAKFLLISLSMNEKIRLYHFSIHGADKEGLYNSKVSREIGLFIEEQKNSCSIQH